MEHAMLRQAAELATAEGRACSLEGQLAERMRWIESLETSQTLHRKRIEELYDQLRLVLTLTPEEIADMPARKRGGDGGGDGAPAGGDLSPRGVHSGVAGAATAAAAELEASLLQAELAGLNERVRLLSDERTKMLEQVVSSESIQGLISRGSRNGESASAEGAGGGGPGRGGGGNAGEAEGPLDEAIADDDDDVATAGPAGETGPRRVRWA